MKIEVRLSGIRNIENLSFVIPQKEGVYLLTGQNGCGKTTLLTAIYRINEANAFRNYYTQAREDVDQYSSSKISYNINGQMVTYQHKNSRWQPVPRTNSKLLITNKFCNALFMSTSGLRFFLPDKSKIPSGQLKYKNVSVDIKKAMNEILYVSKFDDLKYVQINNKIGRRGFPARSDMLYLIKKPTGIYTEFSFSLGERLLLNILDFIDRIQDHSLLLIDEIELALHPIAQVKLYDYLSEIAKHKHLIVLISTHSASLIKHAKKIYYMENNNGEVCVMDDCRPAYILKDVSAEEERNPDYLLFVEDEMAKMLLEGILHYNDVAKEKHRVYRVIKVGGFREVMNMTKQFYSIYPFDNKKVCAFLDADVYDVIRDTREKGKGQTPEEKLLLKNFDDLKADGNVVFLNITPELGVFNWIMQNPLKLMEAIKENYGEQMFRMEEIMTSIKNKYGEAIAKDRKTAKMALHDLADMLLIKIGCNEIAHVYHDMMYAYAKHCNDDQELKEQYTQKLEKVLNR